MFIFILLITLSFSFCLQILVIIQYLSTKSESYYRTFLGTFIINTVLMIITSVAIFKDSSSLAAIDIKFILWIVSGFVLIFILFIKISTIMKIYKRSKDPQFYSINFFGKKVYEKGVIKPHEFLTLILTMPFFLMVGSYFIARLVNMLLYGHL
ncbi:MAG TPA: hypothetical protein PKG60_10695 [Spirochaetota bacterium]|nr:hypothetical protein [Spirochaetota bacterium]HPS85417.1 hypothetical protein [Spirochaetota bacterium]